MGFSAAAIVARRSPAGCGSANDRAARSAAVSGAWRGRVGGGGVAPSARTRGGSGASARDGAASAGTGVPAKTRATGRRGRVPPPPRPPVSGHWPATARRGAPSPTPPPTQRAACPPRVSMGSHGHATGGGGVGHAHRTGGKVRGGGAERVVWWSGTQRPLALGRRLAVCGGGAIRTPYPPAP